ncbi:ABC transporter permease [Deinococcus sonorensis]|uniref:ABC transporter permease n=2 Tax=Deinococcus sonorensis TaxID=309891 RepID=A0AAU7UAV6_9DEIO
MAIFLLRRLLNLLPTFLLASVLVFFIIYLAPGDFLTPARLNPGISAQQLHNLAERFGLDRPVYQQYLQWLWNMLHGDLGLSFQYTQPVLDVAWPRVVNSMKLVAVYLVLFYAISIPLGVYGAVRQYSLGDRISGVVFYFLLGFPSFFIALLAIFGILKLRQATGWQIPIGGMTSNNYDQLSAAGKFWDTFKHLIIPGLVLAVGDVAGFTRVLRGQMLEHLRSDFIRTARSKGVPEFSVVYKHTLRNAIIPFVAGIGGLLPTLIGGAGFVEVVFAYPGITPMLLDALNAQDFYLIAGFSVLTMVLLFFGNAISDILLTMVDPRIRYS